MKKIMDEDKLTDEEKKLLAEADRELEELRSATVRFKKKTGELVSEIKKGIAEQDKEFDTLEKDVASFEKNNKDEIDSLALKSLTGE
ncbi:MAG: hypothetical protein G01um1014107_162 [Parcubacteria group bacterium Gr01-1014_107]|nr:MAG: hypothetical protein G01um1014107_162 [Parcubacteria group bacterium Gr01-1014_107]